MSDRPRPELYDRLRSVRDDSLFVRHARAANPALALVPNLRCGEWYTPPALTAAQAYFKSTDGHTGEWDFSLRRANMHLLPLIEEHGGIIIVDATRRGKRYPDALSKTIPQWCATLNHALVLRRQRAASSTFPPGTRQGGEAAWQEVVVPETSVGPSEKWDIEQRVDGWAERLLASSLPLPELKYPLRPVHISRSTHDPPPALAPAHELGYYPVVCLSASLYITADSERQRPAAFNAGSADAAAEAGPAVAGDAWRYEQGAGDDHELWSASLTPCGFWALPEHWPTLGRAGVHALVERAAGGASGAQGAAGAVDRVLPAGRVLLGAAPIAEDVRARFAVIELSSAASSTGADAGVLPSATSSLPVPSSLLLPSKPPKAALPSPAHLRAALAFAAHHLARGTDVLVLDAHGGTDGAVGVGVVLLQALFDAEGELRAEATIEGASKQTLSTRLQWAITARSSANPSRKTLQHVNQFFMSGAHRPGGAGAGEEA